MIELNVLISYCPRLRLKLLITDSSNHFQDHNYKSRFNNHQYIFDSTAWNRFKYKESLFHFVLVLGINITSFNSKCPLTRSKWREKCMWRSSYFTLFYLACAYWIKWRFLIQITCIKFKLVLILISNFESQWKFSKFQT